MTALYHLAGGMATPAEQTRGPWQADAQHGGPPAALLARLIEGAATEEQWLARLHVELLAPVPLQPLSTAVEVQPLSRRVAVASAALHADERPVARATGRLLTQSPHPDPKRIVQHHRAPPPATAERRAPSWLVDPSMTMFHRDAVRYRWETGDFEAAGSAACWMRLVCPVVAGERPSGSQRIAAVADIASGVSAIYTRADGYGLINSDLDLAFVRSPRDEWLLIEATSWAGEAGTGVCTSIISDTTGVVAAGSQTLLGRPVR